MTIHLPPDGFRHYLREAHSRFVEAQRHSIMHQEIFDVVNEHDEVTCHLPRAEVHRLGLLHRAVHVLVFDQEGRLFLQKRSMKKDMWPGAWDSSASGHLDTGEDYDACAIRELHEELGVMVDEPPERLFKIDACWETGQEFCWIYRLQHNGPFELHPDEIERGEWFSIGEISKLVETRPGDYASAFVLIWKIMRQRELA